MLKTCSCPLVINLTIQTGYRMRVHIAPTYPLACLLVLVFMQLIFVFLLPGGGIPDASVKYVADLMEDLHTLPTIEELASLISAPLKKPLPIMDFLFTELGDKASFVPTQPLSQVCGVHVLSQVCTLDLSIVVKPHNAEYTYK